MVQFGGSGVAGDRGAAEDVFGLSRPLVVTDPVMVKTGLLRRCTDALEAGGVAYRRVQRDDSGADRYGDRRKA